MNSNPAHFRDLLQPGSRARYVAWRLLGARNPILVKLTSGLELRIRSQSTTDYGVAWDIFWRGCYQSPEPVSAVRRIVDLGANVGYSCLFWCRQYPEAHITAFEPHPEHVKAIAGHLINNGLVQRVEVVPAAAGTAQQFLNLSDGGSSSRLTESTSGFQVPVVDLFERVSGDIDLLKIDIEGSEYKLLADQRFGRLNARALVLEWHSTPEHPDGKTWCLEKLQAWGYRTKIGLEDLPLAGLIWGFRD